jgi:hypothetical protein
MLLARAGRPGYLRVDTVHQGDWLVENISYIRVESADAAVERWITPFSRYSTSLPTPPGLPNPTQWHTQNERLFSAPFLHLFHIYAACDGEGLAPWGDEIVVADRGLYQFHRIPESVVLLALIGLLGAKPDKVFVDQAATPSSRKMPAMATRTVS